MVGVVYIINCFKGVQKMRTGKLIMYFLFYFFRLRIQTLLITIFVIQIYQWKTERCKDILLRNSFLEFHEKLFAIMLRIFLQNENSIKSRSEHKTLFRKKQLYSFIQHLCQHLIKQNNTENMDDFKISWSKYFAVQIPYGQFEYQYSTPTPFFILFRLMSINQYQCSQ